MGGKFQCFHSHQAQQPQVWLRLRLLGSLTGRNIIQPVWACWSLLWIWKCSSHYPEDFFLLKATMIAPLYRCSWTPGRSTVCVRVSVCSFGVQRQQQWRWQRVKVSDYQWALKKPPASAVTHSTGIAHRQRLPGSQPEPCPLPGSYTS